MLTNYIFLLGGGGRVEKGYRPFLLSSYFTNICTISVLNKKIIHKKTTDSQNVTSPCIFNANIDIIYVNYTPV